jgi:demethylmenaquinone methyltransferase/2-methoxy-6-polyprenyl-1,4-benzoquinol methylase
MTPRIKKHYPPVEEMSAAERVGMVREVFATIPAHYDILNRIFSLRRDVAWRRFAVGKMRFGPTMRFLDVATGTADLALETARQHPDVRVTGLDFAREMMAVGVAKFRKPGLVERIRLIQGDALNLPFPDRTFDVAGCAFGIRNIPDRPRALREMTRVVHPGGQVLILEMHFPQHRLLKPFYHVYLNLLLPRAAGLVSRNPAAYHYLGDSILHFPAPAAFAGLMAEAGLIRVARHPLMFGICYLYLGWKPEDPS